MRRQISKLQIIRFRRWSRKGYAIFCSLGKSVVIGYLKKGIVEIALKKQSNVCVLSTVGRQDITDEKEGESPDRDVLSFVFLFILFIWPEERAMHSLSGLFMSLTVKNNAERT